MSRVEIIGDCTLYEGDCLDVMPLFVEDKSVDLILCDLPYGTTQNKWDSVIPFEPLWAQYWRVCKPNAAIVLTAAQPFTTQTIGSELEFFRYCWYWRKTRATGFANAKKQPLRNIEDVCVFYKSLPTYTPQGTVRVNKTMRNSRSTGGCNVQGDVLASKNGAMRTPGKEYVQEFSNYPTQVLDFPSEGAVQHPTQKPVALFEYLIKTYTDEGMTVLDNCMGSGTTGVACANTGRGFIGIEREPSYFDIARRRIEEAYRQPRLFAEPVAKTVQPSFDLSGDQT